MNSHDNGEDYSWIKIAPAMQITERLYCVDQ